MNDVFKLVDEMESYFEECKKMPFSNKVVVDMEIVYEFLTDIRLRLPEELKRSQKIVDEREKIIRDAVAEADAMRKQVESVVSSQVDEHEISKQAYEKADAILARARTAESEMILSAYDYVDEVVGQIQAALVDTMIKTEEHFSKLDDYVKQQVKMFDDNREELEKRRGELSKPVE